MASEDFSSNLLKKLELIPKKDFFEIKKLFRILFKEGEFAYSLYGDKPVSISDQLLNEIQEFDFIDSLSLKENCLNIFSHHNESNKYFLRRWEIWKKFSGSFSFKKYHLIEAKIFNQRRIFLINIPAFHRIVKKNITIFRELIGPDINSNYLLAQLISNDKDLLDLFCNRVDLLGILLGFGQHNAKLFQKRGDLEQSINSPQNIPIDPSETRKKLEKIEEKLESFHKHDSCIIASTNRVMFAADPIHPETIALRKKYDRINLKINAIYEKADWFEQTLLQLGK